MSREHWIDVVPIIGVAVVILLYRNGVVSLPVLLAAVAVGLYPLTKTGSKENLIVSVGVVHVLRITAALLD